MKKNVLYSLVFVFISIFTLGAFRLYEEDKPELAISSETEDCITCHAELNPGLVESWYNSRHSKITVAGALNKSELMRRVSTENIDAKYNDIVVGCYECHSLNTDNHKDAFEHNGYKINVVVSPDDCATCHKTEVDQYSKNLMAHAYANLMENPVYLDLKKTITGNIKFHDFDITTEEGNKTTDAEACLYCHGTKLNVTGKETRETDLGEMTFPVIEGWPNQGVGRLNTDGSKGSCTACHPRHSFSIEVARQPYTCAQCHKGPDVPSFKVYEASKHGNIYKSISKNYNFSNVPWIAGKDFTAPTCATCHASLIVNESNTIIAERTHQFNDRLAWRLFGVPYAHPHPISPETSKIKNSAGLPLSVELNAEPVSEFLIDAKEMEKRDNKMKKVCNACHSTSWTDSHFKRLENSIKTTNDLTLTATGILSAAWEKGYARGLPQGESLFDESIERKWTTLWLFHTNSIRLATAMGGGGDYGVFAGGRYQLTNIIRDMHDWFVTQEKLSEKK